MERIVKSREILDSIKSELTKLQQKLGEFSGVDMTNSFLPIDLCASTAMTLQKLSAYEESLFEKIAEFSDAPVATFDDAESILKQAEAEAEKKLLAKKFAGIKTNNPRYDSLLEQLRTAAVGDDPSSTERTIAELLISDLINHTSETAKNELVENSPYYKLAFAFNRNELFYEPQTDGSEPQSSNEPAPEQQNESSENADSSSDSEPPPSPYSAENNKDEFFPDIDLEREEDFKDEKETILDFGLNESEENISENEPLDDNENTAAAAEDENEEDTGDIFYEEEEDEDSSDDTDNKQETESSAEVEINEDIRSIIEQYKDEFAENPNELTLDIAQSPEVNTKHNVTEIINILSPKGRSARSPVKVFQVLMMELLLYGPKTEDDLYVLPDFLKNRISNSVVDGYLEKLYNKGLISRITYDGNVLYYFTQKGLKFNNHDRMISNFYCVDKRTRSAITKRDCRKVYPISNISVCSSVILSRIVKKFPYYLAIGSSDISVEGLCISVISKPNIRIFALSYVSDDAGSLNKLYDNLNRSLRALNVFEKLDTMIVGSYTRNQAAAVYSIAAKSWYEKLVSTKIVLYSYVENKYFEPDTFEEFTDFEDAEEHEILPESVSLENEDILTEDSDSPAEAGDNE